jgi:hypothetical protein
MRLEGATVPCCQGLHLCERQALETSIAGMRLQCDVSLSQPMAQRFGIEAEHLTAVNKSKHCHDQSFSFQIREHYQEKSLGIPRDFSCESGRPLPEDRREKVSPATDRLSCLQPAFGVVIAGTTAVAAAPPRPGQHQLRARSGRPDQMAKQMTHFHNG